MQRLPTDIKAALTPDQLDRLLPLITPSRTDHVLTYRASTKIGGQRVYLSLFSGIEQRSEIRLASEGQAKSLGGLVLKGAIFSLLAAGFLVALTILASILLYLLKSFLGIDLFPGPSFLHDWFFN